MAIDNTDTIDGMAYDEESQAVVLLLTDHLSWKHTKETNILKESDHLVLLQDKINAYKQDDWLKKRKSKKVSNLFK